MHIRCENYIQSNYINLLLEVYTFHIFAVKRELVVYHLLLIQFSNFLISSSLTIFYYSRVVNLLEIIFTHLLHIHNSIFAMQHTLITFFWICDGWNYTGTDGGPARHIRRPQHANFVSLVLFQPTKTALGFFILY